MSGARPRGPLGVVYSSCFLVPTSVFLSLSSAFIMMSKSKHVFSNPRK